MDLADRFEVAVVEAFRAEATSSSLLPLVLVRACVRVLPVSGAGLSLTDSLRIPLAASDQMAATAEQLQTTLGEGPCLSAVASDSPLVAGAAEIAVRWPTFSEGYLRDTPYRSVASLPLLAVDGVRIGALDLYSVDPQPMDPDLVEAVDIAVAGSIAHMLFWQAHDEDGFTPSRWLTGIGVENRMQVWVAIGMLMANLTLSNADALAVLRGHAFSHERTLEEVARQVIDGQLQPDQLLV